MYHCKVSFYFVSCPDSFVSVVQEMPAFKDFEHAFQRSETVEEQLAAKADVIFVGISNGAEDISGIIKSIQKPDTECILLTKQALPEQAFSEQGMDAVSDIWTLPLTEEEMKFRFLRWQQSYKLKKDLWETKNYLDSTINAVPHLIWYKDKVGAHLKVNESFCKAVNKTMEQIEGRGHYYIWDLDPEEYAKGEFICMESEYEVMDKRETCIFDEKVKIRNDMRELKTYKSPLFDLDGSVMGTVGVAMDVTQERLYEQMIINNANTDFLTGLYNRRYLYQYIEAEGKNPFVIYYLDLNRFKSVNDTYGHQEGDRALILTKETLQKCMPNDMLARLGGDEFLVVQMGTYTEQEIEEKRVWLEEQLDNAFHKEEHFLEISASIGTAVSEGGEAQLDDMISEADAFMYREKSIKKGEGR